MSLKEALISINITNATHAYPKEKKLVWPMYLPLPYIANIKIYRIIKEQFSIILNVSRNGSI